MNVQGGGESLPQAHVEELAGQEWRRKKKKKRKKGVSEIHSSAGEGAQKIVVKYSLGIENSLPLTSKRKRKRGRGGMEASSLFRKRQKEAAERETTTQHLAENRGGRRQLRDKKRKAYSRKRSGSKKKKIPLKQADPSS